MYRSYEVNIVKTWSFTFDGDNMTRDQAISLAYNAVNSGVDADESSLDCTLVAGFDSYAMDELAHQVKDLDWLYRQMSRLPVVADMLRSIDNSPDKAPSRDSLRAVIDVLESAIDSMNKIEIGDDELPEVLRQISKLISRLYKLDRFI